MVIRKPILFTLIKADLFQDMVNESTMPIYFSTSGWRTWSEKFLKNLSMQVST